MNHRDFSKQEAFQEGWRLTKENIGFLIGYQLILYVLTAIFSGVHEGLRWIPWHILGTVIIILVKMGLYNSTLLIAKGEKPGFDQLYKNWRLFISWLVASIFFGIMFLVGLVLLIVPGCYVWGRYGLFPFFLLDRDLGPVEALEETAKGSEGIRWQLFLFFLACLGLNLLGVLFFLIGLFITVPVSILAMAHVYRKTTTNGATLAPEKI